VGAREWVEVTKLSLKQIYPINNKQPKNNTNRKEIGPKVQIL